MLIPCAVGGATYGSPQGPQKIADSLAQSGTSLRFCSDTSDVCCLGEWSDPEGIPEPDLIIPAEYWRKS
jgi:hypothetical protein